MRKVFDYIRELKHSVAHHALKVLNNSIVTTVYADLDNDVIFVINYIGHTKGQHEIDAELRSPDVLDGFSSGNGIYTIIWDYESDQVGEFGMIELKGGWYADSIVFYKSLDEEDGE